MRPQAGGRVLQHQVGFWNEAPHGQAGMDLIRNMQMRNIHPFLIQTLCIGNAFIYQGINAGSHQEGWRKAGE
jgi:hypothetical protein